MYSLWFLPAVLLAGLLCAVWRSLQANQHEFSAHSASAVTIFEEAA
jgi:hypothetical protein